MGGQAKEGQEAELERMEGFTQCYLLAGISKTTSCTDAMSLLQQQNIYFMYCIACFASVACFRHYTMKAGLVQLSSEQCKCQFNQPT